MGGEGHIVARGSWGLFGVKKGISGNPTRENPTDEQQPLPKEQFPITAQLTTIEKMKPITVETPLEWHIWTVISCSATVCLLYLNFSGHVIGTEVGRNARETTTIMAALQLAAKAHETVILASLICIVREWVQRCLIGSGTVLGLLGIERSLPTVSILISNEFRAAVSYGISGLRSQATSGEGTGDQEIRDRGVKSREIRRNVFYLVGFVSLSCFLGAVAGPASAILAIPRRDWTYEQSYQAIKQHDVSPSYQNVFIDPALSYNTSSVGRTTFLTNQYNYWSYILVFKENSTLFDEENRIHQFTQRGVPVTVNTTTTANRPLTVEAGWKGGTKFSSVIVWDLVGAIKRLATYTPLRQNRGSELRIIAEMTGLESTTVCRRRKKLSCGDGMLDPGSSEWCYLAVSSNSSQGPLQSSQNLLMILDKQHTTDRYGPLTLPRFWMTEGPRMAMNHRFSDSIVFVFEDANNGTAPVDSLLTVCTSSATLKSVTAQSKNKLFSAEHAIYHDSLTYFDGKHTITTPPRNLLYHENWLDYLHLGLMWSPAMEARTYPSRIGSGPTANSNLTDWAKLVQSSSSFNRGLVWRLYQLVEDPEAVIFEYIVGGAYMSVLLAMKSSNSPYPAIFDWNVPSDTGMPGIGAAVSYPDELMPEPMMDYSTFIYPPDKIYRRVYGFRLSPIGMFGAMILTVHAAISLIGSIWQCREGRVFKGWDSIPSYAALCLGSSLRNGALKNTCSGIENRETFKEVIRVMETTDEHVELLVEFQNCHPDGQSYQGKLDEAAPKEVDTKKPYGFISGGKGSKVKAA